MKFWKKDGGKLRFSSHRLLGIGFEEALITGVSRVQDACVSQIVNILELDFASAVKFWKKDGGKLRFSSHRLMNLSLCSLWHSTR